MKAPFLKMFLVLICWMSALCLTPLAVMAQEKDKDTVVVQAIDTTWMTELPVIELTYNKARLNSDSFIPGRMVYHSIDSTRQFSCTIRRRGGTSLLFDKPN